MRFSLLLIIFLSFSFIGTSQTLKGKVYNSISVVKDIKVLNKTQNRLTVTDKNGDFSIEAKVNDTISFESVFYHPKLVILQTSHFDDINVFEIKKITNQLDEVEIEAEPEQPVFEAETYNTELRNLIKEDIKRNPGLYRPANATYGVDFVYLIGQVVKLFKRKKKKSPQYNPITYEQFNSLFDKSLLFDERLVTEDLKIPEDKIKLFYDFCSAKGISSELLKDGNEMKLLEELVLSSQLFLILIETYGEQATSKD